MPRDEDKCKYITIPRVPVVYEAQSENEISTQLGAKDRNVYVVRCKQGQTALDFIVVNTAKRQFFFIQVSYQKYKN